jgi:hypothetical protein
MSSTTHLSALYTTQPFVDWRRLLLFVSAFPMHVLHEQRVRNTPSSPLRGIHVSCGLPETTNTETVSGHLTRNDVVVASGSRCGQTKGAAAWDKARTHRPPKLSSCKQTAPSRKIIAPGAISQLIQLIQLIHGSNPANPANRLECTTSDGDANYAPTIV